MYIYHTAHPYKHTEIGQIRGPTSLLEAYRAMDVVQEYREDLLIKEKALGFDAQHRKKKKTQNLLQRYSNHNLLLLTQRQTNLSMEEFESSEVSPYNHPIFQ